MWKKYLLPAASLGMLLFAILHVVRGQQTRPKLEPPDPPARVPFERAVAASGIIEAETENISVGSYLPGVVVEVFVKVGNEVEKGAPLFRLDDRALRAELGARKAALESARAQLLRLDAMPRPEEVPPSRAKVAEARENLLDWEDQARRAEALHNTRAGTEEDLVRKRQGASVAREQLARAEADLKLLEAGAWQADRRVTEAAVKQAEAQVVQTEIELERLVVKALVPGEVLQVNVRPGEFVGAPPDKVLIVLGNVRQMHVRADIDEHDIPRFRPDATAVASPRGDPHQRLPLRFVRLEPYVIPKKSLTGDNTERVDTRVLQVIYCIERRGDRRVYVGQQLDVFLEDGGR
jgi:multidrug resistance efflux pump